MRSPHAHLSDYSDEILQARRRLKLLSSLRWAPDFEAKFREQTSKPNPQSVFYRYPAPNLKAKEKFQRRLDSLRNKNTTFIHQTSRDAASIFDSVLDDLDNSFDLQLLAGHEGFGEKSSLIFGSVARTPKGLTPQIVRLAKHFSSTLSALGDEEIDRLYPKVLSAEALREILVSRLREAHLIQDIGIFVSDNLTADAAAGPTYVKLKKGARFSIKDADVLLYHEIFTHIVTNLNGRAQKYAGWLAFDSPRVSTTQEGLAVFLEIVAGKTYPRRLRKIVDRILLLDMICQGDSCAHLYDWLRDRGYNHKDSLSLLIRAYRGMAPGGKSPFTKDLTYLQGLINVFNFIKVNLEKSRYDRIETLFCGKLSLEDIPALSRLRKEGIVEAPRWVPPQFQDLDALVTWFSCVIALGSLDSSKLQKSYDYI